MSTRDALLAAVRENLDDDLPRLVFADWLEEQGHAARAAFIRRQCRLARVRDTDPDFFDLKHELCLHPPDPKWVAELPPKLRKVGHPYRRGFVDEISLSAKKFVADSDGLFETTAVRRASLSAVKNQVWHLTDCPALDGVADLNLAGNKLGDQGVCTLIASERLRRVRGLNLAGTGLTVGAGDFLAASHDLPALRRLQISGCNLRDMGVERFVAAPQFAGLTDLDVSNCQSGPRSMRAIADSLRNLRVLNFSGNRLNDKTADALLDGDAFPELMTLDLFAGYRPIDTGFPAWGELVRSPLFRRLTDLRIDCDKVPDEDWANLPHDFGPPGLALHFQSWHAGTILRLAESPLLARCVRLQVRAPDNGEDVLRAVAENPAAANLRGLTVRPAWGARPPGLGRALAAVAASPHLGNLLDLGYHRQLSDDDIVTLSRAAFAGELRQLTFDPDGLTAKGLALLADPAAFPKLRNLGVHAHGLHLRQPAATQALRGRFGPGFGWSW